MPSASSCIVLTTMLVAGCSGSSLPPSPTATPTPKPSATATVTAAPTMTDTEKVAVLAVGVGDYDLQAIPVAELRNQASAHAAQSVVVTFAVHHPGGTYKLNAPAVTLAPGQTLAVSALCTDACRGATSSDASVSIGSWAAATSPVFPPAAGRWACGSPCAGSGGFEGDATGALRGDVSAGAQVNLFASCTTGRGAIVGGGLTLRTWPGPGQAVTVTVPVLVTRKPSSCELYAGPI